MQTILYWYILPMVASISYAVYYGRNAKSGYGRKESRDMIKVALIPILNVILAITGVVDVIVKCCSKVFGVWLDKFAEFLIPDKEEK